MVYYFFMIRNTVSIPIILRYYPCDDYMFMNSSLFFVVLMQLQKILQYEQTSASQVIRKTKAKNRYLLKAEV